MSREYDQLAWVDYPETLTPISAANLNRMENGIANLYTDRNKMESNIAYVEEGETATRHYFINSYLMLNGIFYKTTSEINIGDILDPTLAGNIEHVDISSQFGSGGGGSTGCVELTQAQYDALSDEAKMLDVIYLITDSPDNYLDEVFGDFATVEYTDTASKAYAVGDYLVYDSKFYRVSSAIAQGDTIVPDTNVVKTTVADEFSNATNVDYDNSASGWIATNVQDALDEMSNASVVYRGYFDTEVDLNDYESPGIYTFGTAVPTNAPLADAYGTLIAMRGHWPFQVLVYANNRIYTRTKTGSPAAWGPWNISAEETGSASAGSTFGGTVYYQRRNGIVFVFMSYSQLTGLTASTDNILGTVPAGFRPFGNSPIQPTNNGDGYLYVQGSTGRVIVHPKPNVTSLYTGFTFTYIAYS